MFLIGIAGGSGSGKTTFAKKILERTEQANTPAVSLLHQDSYYCATPPPHLEVNGELNFDHPDAFDWNLLHSHLTDLSEGRSIQIPHYDYQNNRRTAETTILKPTQAIILEGIYALWDKEIRSLFDLQIYLHVDADIRFIRRLHRDVQERGRSIDSIIRQYYDTVRPMHQRYLEPTNQYADLIVGEETDRAAETVASHLIRVLQA